LKQTYQFIASKNNKITQMAMLKDLKQSMIIVLYLFAYKQNVSAKVKPRPSS